MAKTSPPKSVQPSPEQSGGELDFSTTPKRERVDMPSSPKPKIEMVKVLNIHDRVSFTGPDGRKVRGGETCWLSPAQAAPLVKRNIAEIVDRDTF